MVIDEMATNRNVLTTLLRYADCDVESFDAPAAAMRRLGEKNFELILQDVRQLDRGITDSLQGLRSSAAFEPLKVAVSTNVFPGVEDMAATAGFDGFLGKPFSEEQLFGLITRLLDMPFEARPAQHEIPFDAHPAWPEHLAVDTAGRIREAIELGDVSSLFQLAEELGENRAVPSVDAENMALMTRMFDFDGLLKMSERLQEPQ